MGRKCSHCGNIGHNSRTCNANKGAASASASAAAVGGGLRLFGVHLDVSSYSSSSLSSPAISMKKSSSMDCLSSSSSPSSSLSSTLLSIDEDKTSIGYLSDGLMVGRTQQEKKKGVPWTEEEHRRFLMGLEKLGKGDWRGISKNFVITRTPTQVASHAQKYFLRQASLNKKKRRSSLFDMVGSRTTMAGHHVHSCGSKPSNHHHHHHHLFLPAQDPKPENGSRHEKIMPLIDLISSETHESAASFSSSSSSQQQQQQVVPIWVQESKLHPNNPSNNIASKPSSRLNAAAAAADHDLELTLATPTTIRSPITVT